MKYPRTIACSLLFVYIMLFLNACARNAVEVIGINDTGTTTAQITQVKTFNQCESASGFKAQIQFSNTDSQQNERELVLTVGATGETGVPFFVRAELEGQIETHLKSSRTETIRHEEGAWIEVPAYTRQEYTITWREARRQGVIHYIENGKTKAANYSVRTGLELVSTDVKDLICPGRVASSQVADPTAVATYTALAPFSVTDTLTPTTLQTSTYTPIPTLFATSTSTLNLPTNTLTPTSASAPPTSTNLAPTATPTIRPTYTLVPLTRTPTSTIALTVLTRTPRSQPLATHFSDEFEDDRYDDSVNPTLWRKQVLRDCDLAQKGGVLIIKNKESENRVYCDLIAHQNTVQLQIPFTGLGAIEARMKISADHQGSLVNHGIRIATPGWYAFCGLASDGGSVMLVFDLGWQIDKWEYISNAVADKWYIFRLTVEPESMKVSCTVDGKLLGAIVPEKVTQLQDALFGLDIASHRDPKSSATTYVDYYRVTSR